MHAPSFHPLPALALLALCGCLSGAAPAQTAPGGGAGQVQFVPLEQFEAMVRAAALAPVSRETFEDQRQALNRARQRSRAIVDAYLDRYPDLADLRRLLRATPDIGRRLPNDGVVRPETGDGYRFSFINKNGIRQSIGMMGQENKLAQLANSIQQLSLPAVQRQLYATFYNQLPPSFCRPPGTVGSQTPACAGLPTPAALEGASLQTIHQAIQQLASHTSEIIAQVQNPIALEPIGCQGEIGNNNSADANATWGDQTSTQGCAPPAADGIYANFNFPNKGLLSCIKNQGRRGTCHIFAATSAMEELIARDTGTYVNLNEQDFQEHLKMLWEKNVPDLSNDNGGGGFDLFSAGQNGYRFAYENQWDYNPSIDRGTNDVNSCVGYPASEPGCSDTAPQAVEVCTLDIRLVSPLRCGFMLATLTGARSPYTAGGIVDVWNGSEKDLTFDYMILGLAFNNAVMLGFNVTDSFQGSPDGYVGFDLNDLSTSVGGHMVHVVGFVSNQDLAAALPSAPPGAGGGYFIIKNSWGACTGDAGYYYMPVTYLLAEASEVDIFSSIGQ
ncbi:MAG TPA: C1 family peptidase [Terriglobales bacterium]|nr:C1 family peptidase [Terriglobales bacterium]